MTDRFKTWVDRAVKQMRFTFDREPVRQELLDHLEDRRQGYLDRGMSEDEAGERALAAMGDAVETGRLLDQTHSPWLGWAWLVSQILCGGLVLCLLAWALLNSPHTWFGDLWDALLMDDPCILTEWYEKQNVPYTVMDDTMAMEIGDYTMELDHGFFAEDEYSYSVYLGWQVRSRKPWLKFPKGLWNMTVEDSFGNVFTDSSQNLPGHPHAEFYFNTSAAHLLPVWQFHVELLYMPYEAVPEWLKFSIPGTNADFTVYLDGEVRS